VCEQEGGSLKDNLHLTGKEDYLRLSKRSVKPSKRSRATNLIYEEKKEGPIWGVRQSVPAGRRLAGRVTRTRKKSSKTLSRKGVEKKNQLKVAQWLKAESAQEIRSYGVVERVCWFYKRQERTATPFSGRRGEHTSILRALGGEIRTMAALKPAQAP